MARSVGFSVVRREASPVPLRPCAPAPLRPAPLCSHVPAAPLPLTRSAPAAPSPGCGRPRCAERRAPRVAPGVHRPALHHGGDQGRRRRPPLPPERRVRAARHPHVTHACAVRGRGEVQWASASEAYSPRCSGTLHSTAPYAHTNPTRAMQCSAAAAGWRALDGEGPPQPAHASSSASSSISLRCCSLMPAGGRVREVRVSRRRDGTRVGGGRARVGRSWQHTQESQSWCSGRGRVGRSWQHTQESQSWCSGRGRRAQGGTRSSGRLLGLREGGLGRRRGRELERRRLELDLARHLQRGQTRQRCTLQRNRTAAGALSKSPARTDAEAQTHSSAKTMRANSASGRHLLVELVLLELLELALQLVVVEVDPRVQLAAARRGHCQWGEARKAGGGGRC